MQTSRYVVKQYIPVLASLALNHQVIRIIRHFTFAVPTFSKNKHTQLVYAVLEFSLYQKQNSNSHCNTIGCEATSSSLILKPTKVILSTHIIKFSIILK